MAEPDTGRRLRVARMLLGAAALIAVVVAFVDAVQEAGEISLPGSGALLGASAVAVGAITCAGTAWALLLGRMPLKRIMPSFAVAQLAKYLPGSIWQAVGQVLGAQAVGSTRRAASFAFVLHVWTQLVAAGLLMPLLLLNDIPRWLAIAAGIGPLGVVTLVGPVTRRAAALLMRVAPRRLAGLDDDLPSQRDLWQATALGFATIAAGGLAFALLMPGEPRWVQIIASFSAAWLIGFIAIPFPAGVGVREFILVVLLGPSYGTAAVLTAAVLHRAVTIGSELLVSLIAALPRLVSGSRAEPAAGEGRHRGPGDGSGA